MQAPAETAFIWLGVPGGTKALPFAPPARSGSSIETKLANGAHIKVDAAVDKAALVVHGLRALKAVALSGLHPERRVTWPARRTTLAGFNGLAAKVQQALGQDPFRFSLSVLCGKPGGITST